MKKIIINKKSIIATIAISSVIGLAGIVMAATAVSLGSADNFAILAGSGVTASNPSTISGDVGLSPSAGTLYTGLTSAMVTGTIYAVDGTGPAGSVNNPGLLTTAKNALTTAYLNAAGQGPTSPIVADLGGQTLTPGIYNSASSIGLTGTLTLNAQGNPNAVFIFQAGSTLTTASASNVSLINGAQACNVFWQVGSSATLGTNSTFNGNILAFTAITDAGGSIVNGRLLARNGAVTVNNTTVIKASCVSPSSSSSGSFGTSGIQHLPLINVTKVPSPLSLPSGPGPVTFTYVTTNIGEVPIIGMWIKDDKCSPINYVSGDSNNNGALDLNEAWTYRCSKTVTQTETDTVTAYGKSAQGWETYDTANATVVVSAPITPPLIHLTKRPNVFVLPAGGGTVTYTYLVTNPGIVPLSDVSIIDDKCTGLPGRVYGHPGDLNKNNLLENNETWQFTCVSNLTRTTTNTATAEGHANGLTALDFAQATVAVNTPGLPNTGYGPENRNPLWVFILPLGLLSLITALFVARKKNTV